MFRTSGKDKFRVGDLVEYKHGTKTNLGIITRIGLEYPDTGQRRQRYADVHWHDGETSAIWIGFGVGWEMMEVVCRVEK
tara:strand:- start:41 stop:277 length:237 start_codon:yes stop_codon:yes gene_type:complete